ncbi:MAG: Gldg family protein [Planctomycetes bacterium]|nr:Gldg family protein [Planctomycetota bacterium]
MALGKQPAAESAGRATRLRFGVQFALAAFLFALLALLLTRLSERTSVRWRFDWTRGSENTLEPAALEVLAQLPEDVTIDIFFRAAEYPLEELVIRAQERVRRLLYILRDASGGRVRLVQHDLSSGRLDELSQTRLNELGTREVEPGGLLGISAGKRHALVKLRGDIADFDKGDPAGMQGVPRPPSMVSFRGEEALVNALMKVARNDAPRVLFTIGHGEYDLESAEFLGLSKFKAALEADGFVVGSWDFQKTPELPEDCRVLASIGPVQPFAPNEFLALKRYVERGGRFVAMPAPDPLPPQDSLRQLASPWGLEIAEKGLVCAPQVDVSGRPQTGNAQCGQQLVDQTGLSQHPIVEPLRRSGRRVAILNAHALDVGRGFPGSTVLPVLRAVEGSWLDLPEEGAKVGDWKPSADESRRPFVLGAAILFPPQLGAGAPLRNAEDQRPEAHVFVFGAAMCAVNGNFEADRDLFLNAFNWAAARDWRVSVGARVPEEHRLDMQDESKVARTNFALVIALPLLSLLLGLFTAWRRRR